jgi:2-oxoglutarate dehydrogenase E2 component (dihydrolipoamide succinyltransferase)
MAFEVKVPPAGESIASANVAQWHREDGSRVEKGDPLVTLETDKVSNELEAEIGGILHIKVQAGEEVGIGTVIAEITADAGNAEPVVKAPVTDPGATPDAHKPQPDEPAAAEEIAVRVPPAGESISSANVARWHFKDGQSVAKGDALVTLETDKVSTELEAEASGRLKILVAEGNEVQIGTVIAMLSTGAPSSTVAIEPPNPIPDKQVAPAMPAPQPVATPAPVAQPASAAAQPAATAPRMKPDLSVLPTPERSAPAAAVFDGRTTRRKMSMLRRKIATHLVNAQQTAAILTTFNEVDMTEIMGLRKQVQDRFMEKHGVKLGFMSFFVKAVVQALKDVPQVNGRIDGQDIVENHFYDIGVAIGTEKGLIVPVLRDCDQKSFATIEQDILDYAAKARDGKIQIEDLQGGVFTISNGGVYGSLLSTPILNPPQSGILGMHTIQQRPVAINGKVEIRPMMYLALSYDHRLVDGKEGVTFLIRIKDLLENPTRMLLEM